MKKMMTALVGLLFLATPVFAEMKIAYVDLQKALNLSKAGVQAKSEINDLVKKYEAEFKGKQDELLKMKTDLDKQASLLSETARTEKEREYQKNVVEIQRFQKDVKDELQLKDTEHTKRILNELFEILQKIGKDGGYTLILEKNEGAVIYADNSIDVTDALIKAYDAGK